MTNTDKLSTESSESESSKSESSQSESSKSPELKKRPTRATRTTRPERQQNHQRRSASPATRPRLRLSISNERRRTPPPPPNTPRKPPPSLPNPIEAARSQILAWLQIRRATTTTTTGGDDPAAHHLLLGAQPMLENMLKADFPAAIAAYCAIDQGENPDEALGKMYIAHLRRVGVVQALWASRLFQRLFDTKRGATRVARLLCSGYVTTTGEEEEAAGGPGGGGGGVAVAAEREESSGESAESW
ncbi:MAG: hypothetical protein LQ346_008042 [Caloplaca aetnensis]|nr:MAG: hypothetical protein LQ346_008042 [Caloplaca aetnensis]